MKGLQCVAEWDIRDFLSRLVACGRTWLYVFLFG
jgi:hypothetical protein